MVCKAEKLIWKHEGQQSKSSKHQRWRGGMQQQEGSVKQLPGGAYKGCSACSKHSSFAIVDLLVPNSHTEKSQGHKTDLGIMVLLLLLSSLQAVFSL